MAIRQKCQNSKVGMRGIMWSLTTADPVCDAVHMPSLQRALHVHQWETGQWHRCKDSSVWSLRWRGCGPGWPGWSYPCIVWGGSWSLLVLSGHPQAREREKERAVVMGSSHSNILYTCDLSLHSPALFVQHATSQQHWIISRACYPVLRFTNILHAQLG